MRIFLIIITDSIEIIRFENKYNPKIASERIISKSVTIKSNIEKKELNQAVTAIKKIFNCNESHFLRKEIDIVRIPKAAETQQLYKKNTSVVQPLNNPGASKK